ncbi:glycoside hydrolase family 88 protein [Paractinoplanes toevensis]|uniref:Glycosyl hydrolase n=1 Tax=Paractinoplanes toevensis TaxID=571911 RepID=A0A919W658_9ACTN|nr:glycoside hydrolase family 88 protein [Actinoplanes toevensis]GIM94055.1 glycosyl hydrolase [Actinoplanes toevensis]
MTAIDVRAEAVAAAVAAALRTIDENIASFGAGYPGDTTAGGKYAERAGNVGWTTSFWPGMVWLAHELTGDPSYARAAAAHVPSFAERITTRSDVDTHDLGFLYTLSCVVPWELAGDTVARDAAVAAADHLLTRVLEPAGIIQAWGDMTDPRQQGRTIIDSLMNTPLLFWASEITGDPRYAEVARRHTVQLRDHILRPDGTTFHTFYWDPVTGEPLRGETEQGNSDESCWARGQAWGIYGFALNHRHTGDPTLRDAARTCAERFLSRLPADDVPYWDLVFGDGSGEERDSSAAAIAVCGLLTLGGERYRAAAGRILGSLIDHYSTAARPESNALILHGVYDKPKGVGVDEGNLWGDYFYLEALTRVTRPDWSDHW